MALSEEHWAKIIESVGIATGHGVSLADSPLLLVFKENWETFSTERDLDAFLKAQKIADLQGLRASAEAQQAACATRIKEIDAAIKELER